MVTSHIVLEECASTDFKLLLSLTRKVSSLFLMNLSQMVIIDLYDHIQFPNELAA